VARGWTGRQTDRILEEEGKREREPTQSPNACTDHVTRTALLVRERMKKRERTNVRVEEKEKIHQSTPIPSIAPPPTNATRSAHVAW